MADRQVSYLHRDSTFNAIPMCLTILSISSSGSVSFHLQVSSHVDWLIRRCRGLPTDLLPLAYLLKVCLALLALTILSPIVSNRWRLHLLHKPRRYCTLGLYTGHDIWSRRMGRKRFGLHCR